MGPPCGVLLDLGTRQNRSPCSPLEVMELAREVNDMEVPHGTRQIGVDWKEAAGRLKAFPGLAWESGRGLPRPQQRVRRFCKELQSYICHDLVLFLVVNVPGAD